MNVKDINDSVFEALFRQAVIDDYNDEIDTIPPREELSKMITFSCEFEYKMKKLFRREQRKDFIKLIIDNGKKVAVFCLVTATLLFSILLFNPEVRATVGKVIVEWYDKFTSFDFKYDIPDSGDMQDWHPEYLPEGFHDSILEKLGRVTNIEYKNDHGQIIYLSYSSQGNATNISVDNENHTIENGTINGYEAFILKAADNDFENGIIWSMQGYTFNIWSKLPMEELMKVAISVSEK